MKRFLKHRERQANVNRNPPLAAAGLVHLSEEYGIRSLHLGSSMVQSAMRIAAPNELQLAYTQCMMCFLLKKLENGRIKRKKHKAGFPGFPSKHA